MPISSSVVSALAGTVAIVTGGSGAIGRAISSSLVAAGRTVVITGRRMDALQSAADTIQAEANGTPGRVIPLVCDVTDEKAVCKLFDNVAGAYGPCALLVNSAGIAVGGPTESLSAADFSKVMAVNVLGPFVCSKFAFSQMQQHGGGRIIK